MRITIKSALILIGICAFFSTTGANGQINIYGIINQMARQAAEQQRRERELEDRHRAQQEIILEQRRREAEIRAQQRHEREKRAAQLRAERLQQEKEEAKRAKLWQEALDAERKKQAAAKLVPAGKQLIEDASDFLKTRPPRALEIVEQISNLNDSLTGGDPHKIQNLMQLLVATLRGEPGYDAFEQRRGEEKREEANAYLASLLKTANQQHDFILYFVTNNPTSPQTRRLLPYIKQIASATSAPALAKLKLLTSQVELAIREFWACGRVSKEQKSFDREIQRARCYLPTKHAPPDKQKFLSN